MAKAFGIEMYEIGLDEAEKLVPMMSASNLKTAFYLAGDGQVAPIGAGSRDCITS